MHGIIYQISASPIKPEHYASEDHIVLSIADYCNRISENKRITLVKRLLSILPAGMFILNADGESLTYQGGMDEWKRGFISSIASLSQKIKPSSLFSWNGEANTIARLINNPLSTNTMFITETWEGGSAEAQGSGCVMELIDTLQPGDILFIGPIFDYHF